MFAGCGRAKALYERAGSHIEPNEALVVLLRRIRVRCLSALSALLCIVTAIHIFAFSLPFGNSKNKKSFQKQNKKRRVLALHKLPGNVNLLEYIHSKTTSEN